MTDIQIVNIAMGMLGAGRIASLDDDSSEGRWAKDNYGPIRDGVLEERKWTFSTRFEQLAQDASVPAFRYGHQYILPSIVLKVWEVYDSVDGENPLDEWEKSGQLVLCDFDTVYAVTTFRCGENLFSPTFVQALGARLAMMGAIPLTENKQLFTDYSGLYEVLVKEAAAADGQQARTKAARAIRLPGRRPTL